MTTIGIVTKPQFPEIIVLLKELIDWLHHHKKKVVLNTSTGKLLGDEQLNKDETLASRADLVVVLGGDGTMLSAARLVNERSIPILGVNMGGLGFLTETTVDKLYESLNKVFAQEFYLDSRLRLEIAISHEGGKPEQGTALNDVVISKGTLGRMITINIQIDKQFVTNLQGDGLIVSSPTGSTAYSMSAGGPILEPSLESLVINPISPHTLSHRPLIVPSQVTLEAKLTSHEGATATLDGQIGMAMNRGDILTIRTSHHPTQLIRVTPTPE